MPSAPSTCALNCCPRLQATRTKALLRDYVAAAHPLLPHDDPQPLEEIDSQDRGAADTAVGSRARAGRRQSDPDHGAGSSRA